VSRCFDTLLCCILEHGLGADILHVVLVGTEVANSNHEDATADEGQTHIHPVEDVARASIDEERCQAAKVSWVSYLQNVKDASACAGLQEQEVSFDKIEVEKREEHQKCENSTR